MKSQPCKTSKRALKSSYSYKNSNHKIPLTEDITQRLIHILRVNNSIPIEENLLKIIAALVSSSRDRKHKYISKKQLSVLVNLEKFIETHHKEHI